MKFLLFAALALLLGATPALAGDLPNVPGVANPAVTQANIKATICVAGWSKKARPPTSYTEPLKKKDMAAAGLPWSTSRNYELDHLISIEIGGSPTDPKNLWVQSYVTKPWNAHVKDRLENFLHEQVCAGKIPLAAAQHAIAADWIAAYQKYLGAP